MGHAVWGKQAPRRTFGDAHWREPVRWSASAEREGKRRRVFCASMADVFEDRRDLDPWRAKLWSLIEATPALDWLLLTKRPENMPGMAPTRWHRGWPLNVWAGTTVENQEWAERRIPHLRLVPAAIRFLSVEPLLGPLDLELEGISWAIVGGESGSHLWDEPTREKRALVAQVGGRWVPREDRAPWVRRIRDRCRESWVAFFLKQWGGPAPSSGGNLLDGREWHEWPPSAAPAPRDLPQAGILNLP